MNNQVDVVVVGAGPVGLLMAIELRLAGVRVVVLEKLDQPATILKAESLGTIAGEVLERRGFAQAMDAEEALARDAVGRFMTSVGVSPDEGKKKFDGHFGGLFLLRRDAQREPQRRPRSIRQDALEAMLAARARELGVEVRRQHEVLSFEEDDAGLLVAWSAPGGAGTMRCSYLVGCDGGRSSIRKRAGFAFPGSDPTLTGWKASARIDHPERLLPMGWQTTPTGLFASGPFPGRLLIVEFDGPPQDRDAPVTCAEIADALRRVSGRDVRVEQLYDATRWTDNCRLVDGYRKGRVLLAGDAAHVHSPFGGQGLNLGLAEAANLGWKLGAVVRGDMPDSLLNTYSAERHPVAASVLANTRAQVAIMRPDPQSAAVRQIIAAAMEFDDVNRMFGEMMSGLDTRYDLGGERDSTGRLVGDLEVRHHGHETRLYDLMHDGAAVLIDASADQRASRLAKGVEGTRCVPNDGPFSMLVRPDGCLAWEREGHDIAGLADALRIWFGSQTACLAEGLEISA